MEIQFLFKCCNCKITAESNFVNGDSTFVRCRRCRADLIGKSAVDMLLQYGKYLVVAEIRYDEIEPVRKAFMRMDNLLHPDRYPFADLQEPGFKFFIDLNKYFGHRNPINEQKAINPNNSRFDYLVESF